MGDSWGTVGTNETHALTWPYATVGTVGTVCPKSRPRRARRARRNHEPHAPKRGKIAKLSNCLHMTRPSMAPPKRAGSLGSGGGALDATHKGAFSSPPRSRLVRHDRREQPMADEGRRESCRGCRWWDWDDATAKATRLGRAGMKYGTCHGGPPVVIRTTHGFRTRWPKTRWDDWCGAYEPEPSGVDS